MIRIIQFPQASIWTTTLLPKNTSRALRLCLFGEGFHETQRHFSCYSNSFEKRNLLHKCDNITLQSGPTRNLSMQGFVDWQQNLYQSISHSTPVDFMQKSLLYVHDISGLPWWLTIILSTITVRSCITLPLNIYQSQILAKVENVSLEMGDIVKGLKQETAIAIKQFKLSEKQAKTLYTRSFRKHWNSLLVRDNCHPFKASILIWFQIPIWVCMSFALRNLVSMQPYNDTAAIITFTELSLGGVAWIPNLTEADHSLTLPFALGIINLALIELQTMSKLRKPSKLNAIFTNVFRVFSVVMIPVAANVPSCMCLYWVTSSSYGLLQNVILLSPSLRRKCRIPEAPSELEDPYRHVQNEIKLRINKIIPLKEKS